MGLRSILYSIGSTIVDNTKKAAKVVAATSLVVFKTGAGGGQAIFGCKKQIAYVRDTLGIPVPAKIEAAYIGTVVGFTIVTSLLTRAGNTFRQVLGKGYLVKLGIINPPNVQNNPLVIVIEPAPNPALILANGPASPRIVLLDDNDEEAQLEPSTRPNVVESDDEEEEKQHIALEQHQSDDVLAEEKVVAVVIDPALVPSRAQLATQIVIDSFVSACSLTSTYFTTINSYKFGKELMGYMESIDANTTATSDDVTTNELVWLQVGAVAITLGNLFSSYYYNSAKARGYGFKFSNWATNLKYNVETQVFTKAIDSNRLSDMWSYRYAIGLTFINFAFSEPSNAFFTTMNSITAVPYVTTLFSDHSIKVISGCSTGTAVVQNIFTNVPSVKILMSPPPEIKAALERLPRSSKALLRFGQLCGSEDSLITGFSYFIAILYTLNKINSNISLTDPIAMSIAAVCGCIKALTNQGFSVNPALIDLLEDIHPELFEDERNKLEIANALAEANANNQNNVAANNDGEHKENNADRSVTIEMQSSQSKKKKHARIDNSDLHEALVIPDRSDIDSDGSDPESQYQPPSLSSSKLTTAKSSPNLYREDNKHGPLPARYSIGKSSTRSPYTKPAEQKSYPSDFYSGLDRALVQSHSPVITQPSASSLHVPPSDLDEHKEDSSHRNASRVSQSRHAFLNAKRGTSSAKKQARTRFETALGAANVEAGIQSEPVQPRRTAVHQHAAAQPVRIVHSSQKSGLFNRKKPTPPRRMMVANDDLEAKYGRSFAGDNF